MVNIWLDDNIDVIIWLDDNIIIWMITFIFIENVTHSQSKHSQSFWDFQKTIISDLTVRKRSQRAEY
jgi:hypothetical protein